MRGVGAVAAVGAVGIVGGFIGRFRPARCRFQGAFGFFGFDFRFNPRFFSGFLSFFFGDFLFDFFEWRRPGVLLVVRLCLFVDRSHLPRFVHRFGLRSSAGADCCRYGDAQRY